MSDSTIHIVAVLSPASGKHDRLLTAIQTLTTQVHAQEPNTLRYLATEVIELNGTPSPSTSSSTPPDIIFMEKYKDLAASDAHREQPHFKTFFKTLSEEGLLRKEPWIAKTRARAGFDLGRELMG